MEAALEKDIQRTKHLRICETPSSGGKCRSSIEEDTTIVKLTTGTNLVHQIKPR